MLQDRAGRCCRHLMTLQEPKPSPSHSSPRGGDEPALPEENQPKRLPIAPWAISHSTSYCVLRWNSRLVPNSFRRFEHVRAKRLPFSPAAPHNHPGAAVSPEEPRPAANRSVTLQHPLLPSLGQPSCPAVSKASVLRCDGRRATLPQPPYSMRTFCHAAPPVSTVSSL